MNEDIKDLKPDLKYEYGCQMPASYGQGVYEEKPEWVADELKPRHSGAGEEDIYEWGDGPEMVEHNEDGEVKAKNIPHCSLVKAGKLNFYLSPGETLEQCPYDKSHQILTPKFSSHLTRCRRNYIQRQESRGMKLEIDVCPHDSSHHVPRDLINEHAASCDATIRHHQRNEDLKRFMTSSESEAKMKGASANANCLTEIRNIKSRPSTDKKSNIGQNQADVENWELAPPARSYNPVERLVETGTCFITPYGMTKSERKDFRQNESRRSFLIKERKKLLEEKARNEKVGTSSNSSSSLKQLEKDHGYFEYKMVEIEKEIEERNEIFRKYMYITRPSDDWYDDDDDDDDKEEVPPRKKVCKENLDSKKQEEEENVV